MQRALPPRQGGVDGRRPLRTLRADRGLLVARGRWHQRLRRRRQHGIPAEVQLRDLSVSRGGERAVLRLSPHRRAHPRAHPGTPRRVDGAQGEDPAPRPGGCVPVEVGGPGPRAHPRPRPGGGRALGAEPGARRPERGHPGLREGGPEPGCKHLPAVPGRRDQPAPGRWLGSRHRPGHLPGRARGKRGRALGAGGGGARGRIPAPDAGRAPLLRDREHPRNRGDGA